jgi:hypothetical protein
MGLTSLKGYTGPVSPVGCGSLLTRKKAIFFKK